MQCLICASEIPSEAKYCSHCGSAAQPEGAQAGARNSTNCGQPVDYGVGYCPSCGNAIQAIISGDFSTRRAAGQIEFIGFWQRLTASILDDIMFVIGLVIVIIIGSAVPLLWIILLPVIIYAVYKLLKCQTLGRRLFGIAVVNEAGGPVSFWRGAFREIVGKTMSSVFLYVGFIWIGFDKDKQGWHDKISSTFVIQRRPSAARR